MTKKNNVKVTFFKGNEVTGEMIMEWVRANEKAAKEGKRILPDRNPWRCGSVRPQMRN